jgi:6-phosphogluconolactonase/glucosamine-6-phosphate isomerase/deaminase
VGISPQNPGSCQYPVRHHLLGPLGIAESQIHFFDAQSADLQAECRKMDGVIAAAGGLDLILVGVGLNGHIGLNEPGISPDLLCHVSELADMTIRVGQKYFDQETPLTQGITLGLGHFMAARKAVVMAAGAGKAAIIRDAVHQDISPELPATILRRHPQGHLLLDETAAALL